MILSDFLPYVDKDTFIYVVEVFLNDDNVDTYNIMVGYRDYLLKVYDCSSFDVLCVSVSRGAYKTSLDISVKFLNQKPLF